MVDVGHMWPAQQSDKSITNPLPQPLRRISGARQPRVAAALLWAAQTEPSTVAGGAPGQDWARTETSRRRERLSPTHKSVGPVVPMCRCLKCVSAVSVCFQERPGPGAVLTQLLHPTTCAWGAAASICSSVTHGCLQAPAATPRGPRAASPTDSRVPLANPEQTTTARLPTSRDTQGRPRQGPTTWPRSSGRGHPPQGPRCRAPHPSPLSRTQDAPPSAVHTDAAFYCWGDMQHTRRETPTASCWRMATGPQREGEDCPPGTAVQKTARPVRWCAPISLCTRLPGTGHVGWSCASVTLHYSSQGTPPSGDSRRQ